MSTFLSMFRNGGPNLSYGRVASGCAVANGLLIFTLSVLVDLWKGRVPDWNTYQTLLNGILFLSGGLYGLTAGKETVQKFAKDKPSEVIAAAAEAGATVTAVQTEAGTAVQTSKGGS